MRNGFTLVELVIVIVIMAILASIAAVSLGGTIDRYRMSQAAEVIERFDARAVTLASPTPTSSPRLIAAKVN
jgi:prepilin-type N-terminal cleavage/methylation domain-containing protein